MCILNDRNVATAKKTLPLNNGLSFNIAFWVATKYLLFFSHRTLNWVIWVYIHTRLIEKETNLFQIRLFNNFFMMRFKVDFRQLYVTMIKKILVIFPKCLTFLLWYLCPYLNNINSYLLRRSWNLNKVALNIRNCRESIIKYRIRTFNHLYSTIF